MSLFHVIYVSTATESHSDAALIKLLDVSRSRNKLLGLTGLLLYANGRFMQVLEGSESGVYEVFNSILKDSRHKNLYRLRFEEKPQRHFPDWRMGFSNLQGLNKDIEGVSSFLEPDFDASAFQDSPIESYRLLLAFRKAHDRW